MDAMNVGRERYKRTTVGLRMQASLSKWARPVALFLCALILGVQGGRAEEVLIDTALHPSGEPIPYLLTYENLSPQYVVILFPGGSGRMDLHIEDGKIAFNFKGNFLIRSRKLLVDQAFATVATSSTQSQEAMQGLLEDLKKRFPAAQIYLMGTSRGTFDTMALAAYLSDKIAGEIHTSSMRQIYAFDPKKYKNRHLIVHHKNDGCHVTPFGSAQYSHEKYGSELLVMEGGRSVGDPCEAFSYHGYNGIEVETIQAIKQWIRQGRPQGGEQSRAQ